MSGDREIGDRDRWNTWNIMHTAPFDLISKTRLYLTFACMLGVLSLAAGMPQSLWSLWRIAAAPATTVGAVTYLHCSDHGHVDYVFEVRGSAVAGARPLVDGAACEDLHAGQRITVYYETTDPVNNYAFAPGDDDGNRATTAFWVGVGFLAGLVLAGPLFLLLVLNTFSRIAALGRA